MRKYLGVKIVEAEPACQHEVSNKDCEEGILGYRVKYDTGYESWSLKETFEKAYRPIDGLTGALAIEAMNQGFKVKVPEWKGYWFKESGMVKVMTAEGRVLETSHFQQYIFREDWQIVQEDCETGLFQS